MSIAQSRLLALILAAKDYREALFTLARAITSGPDVPDAIRNAAIAAALPMHQHDINLVLEEQRIKLTRGKNAAEARRRAKAKARSLNDDSLPEFNPGAVPDYSHLPIKLWPQPEQAVAGMAPIIASGGIPPKPDYIDQSTYDFIIRAVKRELARQGATEYKTDIEATNALLLPNDEDLPDEFTLSTEEGEAHE